MRRREIHKIRRQCQGTMQVKFILSKLKILTFVSFLLLFGSNYAQNSVKKEESFLRLKTLTIKDTSLLKLIEDARTKYSNIFTKKPKIAILRYFQEGTKQIITITIYPFLYDNEEEEKMLDEKFEAGTEIDGNLILLQTIAKPKTFNNLFDVRNKKVNRKIVYGLSLSSCYRYYSIEGNKYVLEKEHDSTDYLSQ